MFEEVGSNGNMHRTPNLGIVQKRLLEGQIVKQLWKCPKTRTTNLGGTINFLFP